MRPPRISTTRSAIYLAIKHVFPDVPMNAGIFDALHVREPKGTFLFAEYPRPVSGCSAEVSQRIAEAVFAALVEAIPDKLFAAGIWTCRPGKFRIDFGRDEFIHLLEGVVIVTDAEGTAKTYRAGDAFVTPKGFSGTWDVIEPVKKHFTYYGAVD